MADTLDIVVTIPGAKYLMWGMRYPLTACKMFLFVNDYWPTVNDTVENYVVATFPGFAPASLNLWTYPYTNESGYSEIDSPIVSFTQTGLPALTQIVYGYIVLNERLQLIYAQRTEQSGYPMSVAPLTYRVRPTLSMGDLG